MRFMTDLNDRERKRYAAALDEMSKTATAARFALEGGDDQDALLRVLMLAFRIPVVNELVEVFKAGITVDVPDTPNGIEEIEGSGR